MRVLHMSFTLNEDVADIVFIKQVMAVIICFNIVSCFFFHNQSIEQFQIRQGIVSSFEPDQGPNCLKRL